MKKIFLFVAVVAALTVNAEDKVWNFATIFSANQTFSVGDGKTPDALVEGELYVYGNAKDKAFAVEVNQSPKYFVDFLTIDDQVNVDGCMTLFSSSYFASFICLRSIASVMQ